MSIFATEFPVSAEVTFKGFLAEAKAWVDGMKDAQVFESPHHDKQETAYCIEHENGERIQFLHLQNLYKEAIGCRYERPDKQGRLWKTDIVLKLRSGPACLRVCTQCVASKAYAYVEPPKRPHFVRQAVERGWGQFDGNFSIQDQPITLTDADLENVAKVITGQGERGLPVVYVSSDFRGPQTQMGEILARNLSGVAHVLIEPDRDYSQKLRDICEWSNAYRGSIGVYIPDFREVKRIHPADNQQELTERVVLSFSSRQEARLGWDWTTLQDEYSKNLQEQNRTKLNDAKEYEEEFQRYEDRIRSKDEEIERLRAKIVTLEKDARQVADDHENDPAWHTGSELYPGEWKDRLRYIVKSADLSEAHPRNKIAQAKFIEGESFTGHAKVQFDEIKHLSKNARDMPKKLGGFLKRRGFSVKSDKSHSVYAPPTGLEGLSAQTLPKTPSDARAGINRATDIIRDWGLRDLFE